MHGRTAVAVKEAVNEGREEPLFPRRRYHGTSPDPSSAQPTSLGKERQNIEIDLGIASGVIQK